MEIEVTDEAVALLLRSMELMRIDSATGGVRVRTARALGGGVDVQVEVADAPMEGEEVVEAGGFRLFVAPELEATIPRPVIAVEPQHETVVVRPGAP